MGTTKDVKPYEQGDIVWAEYPFINTPEDGKIRPAVIISNAICHSSDTNDFILLPVTKTIRVTKFSFFLDKDVLSRSLPEKDCEVRGNKVFTLNKTRIKGRLSEIKQTKIQELLDLVHSAIKKNS
jgi:mRNA-degrading endonuclease toxin of MazEF toxin-antitoxin module